MPMWRCPHCGVPQAEASRCWVCHRSSTCCATCRHFRNAIVANLGYCGRNRSLGVLTRDEIRPCWESQPGTMIPGNPGVEPDARRPLLPMAMPLWLDEA
jgi:hypothetical protein